MKKIAFIISSLLFLFSYQAKAQNNSNFQVLIKMDITQSIEQQKTNIEFFRDFFNTNQCKYIANSNSYEISTSNSYNYIELENKIEKQPGFSNVTVIITKKPSQGINSSEL